MWEPRSFDAAAAHKLRVLELETDSDVPLQFQARRRVCPRRAGTLPSAPTSACWPSPSRDLPANVCALCNQVRTVVSL